MDLEGATKKLYRVAPTQFTSARDAMATQARDAGERGLATSLKKLRKPSVGAWLANLLVLEKSEDVRRLVKLGTELRMPGRTPEGEQIRKASKQKSEMISQLVREATSMASREGQSVSAAALQELETTLDAAFADPEASESLLGGLLISGLHYSGLGFSPPTASEARSVTKSPSAARPTGTASVKVVAAQRRLEKANQEADHADTQLEKTTKAVAEADRTLTRLKLSEAQAARLSKEAHAKASAAKEALDKLRQT
jgi:hypothetical protein